MKKYIVPAIVALSVIGASAEVQKNMVIVGTDGSVTKINRDNISAVHFIEMPDYTDANTLLSAQYAAKENVATYQIDIATGEPDENNDPANPGDFQLRITLVGEKSADATAAMIPAGYYRAGDASKAGAVDVQGSMMWAREDDETVSTDMFTDGYVDVRVDGDTYDIRCELIALSGYEYDVRFRGAIKFSIGASDYGKFDAPQNVAFESGQARFYANWYYPFADDALLQFYTGDFDENHNQVEGYWLNMPVNMPKQENILSPTPVIADGVYSVEPRGSDSNILYSTYLPFTFTGGSEMEYMGSVYPSGTYITYIDRSGSRKLGYITSGTVKVSNGGTQYEFDLLTAEGIAVTGSCTGMYVQNFCDNAGRVEFPFSTLTESKELSFIPETVGLVYNLGDYIVSGVNTLLVRITDPSYTQGDFLTFEIMVEGNEVADGTYTVANTFVDKTALVGWPDSQGNPQFSWYADLNSTDADGVQTVSAPIKSGSFTVATQGDGTKKFTFSLVDDCGNSITGEWTGQLIDGDATASAASMKLLKRR